MTRRRACPRGPAPVREFPGPPICASNWSCTGLTLGCSMVTKATPWWVTFARLLAGRRRPCAWLCGSCSSSSRWRGRSFWPGPYVLPCRYGRSLWVRSRPGCAAAADRRVRIALDLDDPAVLHVHVLAAAHRAVGADRLDHLVGRGGPGPQLRGLPALRGRAAAKRVGASQLAVNGPSPDPAAQTHAAPATRALPD